MVEESKTYFITAAVFILGIFTQLAKANATENWNSDVYYQYLVPIKEEFDRILFDLHQKRQANENNPSGATRYPEMSPDQSQREDMVMGLAFNLDGKGNDEIAVQSHFALPERPLNGSSLCFWLKTFCWHEYNYVLSVNHISFGLHEGRFYTYFNPTSEYFDIMISPHSWHHMCFTFTTTTGASTYLFGKKRSTLSSSEKLTFETGVIPSGLVNVTFSSSSTFNGICGYIADAKMFSDVLNEEQMDAHRLGILNETSSEVSGLKIDRISKNQETTRASISRQELLRPSHNFTLFVANIKLTYSAASNICLGFGGTLPIAEEGEHKQMIAEYLMSSETLSDVWIFVSNWTLNSNSQYCPIINMIHSGVLDFLNWPCNKTCYALMCLIPKIQYVTLKGGDERDSDTFVIVEDHRRPNSLILEGIGNIRVIWENSKYKIEDIDKGILYEQNIGNELLMGRSEWLRYRDESLLNLSLSVCGDEEFTCKSGQCISLARRCDGVKGDCRDLTDDDSGCINFLGPPESYFRLMPPSNSQVSVNILFNSVQSVNMDDNSFRAVLFILLSWRDDRLLFYNLQNQSAIPNLMDKELFRRIWSPFVQMPSATFSDNKDLLKPDDIYFIKLYPEGKGSATQIDSHEAYQYNGNEVKIEVNRASQLSFQCSLNLAAFPFDVQICTIPVLLLGPGNPVMDVDDISIISDNKPLPSYYMPSIRCKVNGSKATARNIDMAILLERRGEAFLLSVVGPCIVLGVLGHLAFLAYSVEDFNERASTSLSLLIVVASLFSQSVSSLPSSASPKAIDFWFFFFIFRFFLFFVAHCLVECQRRRLQKAVNQEADIVSAKTAQKSALKEAWEKQENHNNISRLTRPGSVNLICVITGVLLDIIYLLIFCYYIKVQNNHVYDRFHEYNLCF